MSKNHNVGANAALEGKGTQATNARWITISPTLAEKLLENNRLQRSLKDGHVEKLAMQIKKGLWRENGETIKITKDGDILDGQHRLWAIIESGITLKLLVIDGLEPEVMPTIDTGRARSMADVLTISGGKNATITASALRWLWWYPKRVKVPSGPDMRDASHQQLLDFLEKWPDLQDRITEVLGAKTIKRYVAPSIVSFVYTLAYRQDAAKAGAWLSLLDTGLGIDDERHPVHLLRERMVKNAAEKKLKGRLTPVEVSALCIKSWNQFINGKRTKDLRWRSTEEHFPTVGGKEVQTPKDAKVA